VQDHTTTNVLPLLALLPAGCGAGAVHAPAAVPDLIELRTPLPAAILVSSVTFEGKARGPWFFESSFPRADRKSRRFIPGYPPTRPPEGAAFLATVKYEELVAGA
jgi:hypothetical protein